MSDAARMESFFPKKIVGLELLQNPSVSRKTSFTFKTASTKADNSDTPPATTKLELFQSVIGDRLARLEIPLRAPDRNDPVMVLLEAAYYQYFGQIHLPNGFQDWTPPNQSQ